MHRSAIIVGAGIVGLATARALAVRGYKVTVLERTERAVGASIRNFGMIWPIGQTNGELYERALLSKSIWKKICDEAGIWYDEVGSLHVAHSNLEQQVLEEFHQGTPARNTALLNAADTIKKSGAVISKGLKCSLFSADEMIVDARKAIAVIPEYFGKKYDIKFIWNAGVTRILHPFVWCGEKVFEADEIYVCSGADFETLFPEQFTILPITKCKLQMMRMAAQPPSWRMGPALCGGLSLIHYKSFKSATSLQKLKKHFEESLPGYIKWGIHVMVAQNEKGELTIGDSHEYGITHEPFNKTLINQMILDYLKGFACFKNEKIIETWNGIYSKMENGRTEIVLQPQEGVTIINGLGGAGMTLSFGLCEEIISNKIKTSFGT
jgi:FAD dependent oxidoreductase TIGR03364